jgi:hypothetical protein
MKSIVSALAVVLMILLWSSMAAAQICGDANDDGAYNIGDGTYLINYLYKGGPAPPIYSSGDVDGYEVITANDAMVMGRYGSVTCPPTYKKFSGPVNSGYELSLDPATWSAGVSAMDVNVQIKTNTSFIYIDLPMQFSVGGELASVESVTRDPEFAAWSTYDWKRIYNGRVVLYYADSSYAPIGPFTGSAHTVATLHLTLPSAPTQDENINLSWYAEMPPLHPVYGSSNYPVIVVDWNRGNPLAYTPALPGQRVPSITVWGGIVLVVLLLAFGIWLIARKRQITATT